MPPSSTRLGYGNDDRDWLPFYRVGDAVQDVFDLCSHEEVKAMTREVLSALGAAAVWRGLRPRARDRQWCGWEAVARTDFLAVLIWFERLGLAVDPAPWIERLRPALLRQATVSASELAIFWYPQERRRKGETLIADPQPPRPYEIAEMVTARGYRVRYWQAADGELHGIEMTPPSPSRRRAAE